MENISLINCFYKVLSALATVGFLAVRSVPGSCRKLGKADSIHVEPLYQAGRVVAGDHFVMRDRLAVAKYLAILRLSVMSELMKVLSVPAQRDVLLLVLRDDLFLNYSSDLFGRLAFAFVFI